MEQWSVSGAAHDPSGAGFSTIGISSAPTDWSQIFRALAKSSLHIETLTESVPDVARAAPGPQETPDPNGTQ
ncbi:hypothetical protein [Streptomyces sp. H27-C3]|uniref:hypothetical protein n=1 Tax=Streptomyces sp. H27-C3 TaxID=3046305 RepID=UPI0024B92932|nr:hypothetical protein [Streptomyces sp. H27-C3]MDJ0463949.1 hypothetical protein [Streptomyces sp. H27-C3]